MEEEILQNTITKIVTPLGDFNYQSFPIDKNKCYEITDEELDKLSNHELKWKLEEYEGEEPVYEEQETTQEVEVEDLEKPIFEEVGGIQTVVGYEKKTVETIVPTLVQIGTKLVTKYHVSLIENDNTEELAKQHAGARIIELKQLLTATDYIVIKIAEAISLGQTDLAEELKEEYYEILENRQSYREEINELELVLKPSQRIESED